MELCSKSSTNVWKASLPRGGHGAGVGGDATKTADDLFIKRKVMELKVRCGNTSTGCNWVGELGDIDNHLKIGSVEGQCSFVDVECPLGCGKRTQRQHLSNHKINECTKRPF